MKDLTLQTRMNLFKKLRSKCGFEWQSASLRFYYPRRSYQDSIIAILHFPRVVRMETLVSVEDENDPNTQSHRRTKWTRAIMQYANFHHPPFENFNRCPSDGWIRSTFRNVGLLISRRRAGFAPWLRSGCNMSRAGTCSVMYNLTRGRRQSLLGSI